MIVLPLPFSMAVPKDTGLLDVDLSPSGPGWVWEIYSHSFGVAASYRYVVAPEPVPDPDRPGEFLPVDYPDLVRVDKDTLDPTAVPDPAWWAEVERTVSTGEVVGDDLLLHLRNGETLNAGHVRGLQGEQGQQGVQGEIGPQGIQGDTGAQGIQGERGPQGLQGLPGNATMRVDTTAGEAIYITDGTKERLIKYESGWRALVRWDANGAVTYGTLPTGLEAQQQTQGGGVFIKRTGNRVACSIVAARITGTVAEFTSPVGFRGSTTVPYPVTLAPAHAADGTPTSVYVEIGATVVRLRAGAAGFLLPRNASLYGAEFSWETDTPIPTALPGQPK